MVGSKERGQAYWQEYQTTHVTDTQWGDTGKGKLVDAAATTADIVLKTNGGANAGHTVNNEYGEFKLHLVPAGFANPETLCVVGTGVVVDPLQFVEEYRDIVARVPTPANFLLSDKAHMVMPWHKLQDGLREKARGGQAIGTTGRGIGPAYADRANRTGLRLGDLLRPDFEEQFRLEAAWQQRLTRAMDGEALLSEVGLPWGEGSIHTLQERIAKSKVTEYFHEEAILEQLYEAREILAPLIGNTIPVVRNAYEQGKRIIGEAGQGALLDLDFGGYPYVTSSHPGSIGFQISSGLSPKEIGRVVGSTKAYITRVGNGPMPTEVDDEVGDHLREKGHEYGATTGRPRRTGWFDAVATRYGAQTAGVTEIAVTKLDVLDDLPVINVCVGYEVDGRQYDYLADSDPAFMARAKPIYQQVNGWMKNTSGISDYNDLPPEARGYISFLEEQLRLPITLVSVGPKREETIYRAK